MQSRRCVVLRGVHPRLVRGVVKEAAKEVKLLDVI